MVRVAILGGSGYTALELCRLLLRHPHVELTTLTTRQDDSRHVGDVHPALAGRLNLRLENFSPGEVSQRADCVFSCLPHGASAAVVCELLDAGCRVVDFSADFRLNDPAVYAEWYGTEHPDPARMASAVYGLPELFREQIVGAQLVANPGCYPTSAILALAPLLKAGVIGTEGIIVDSKSGVSGAGRQPKANLHFPECNESLAAYGVGQHRHTPEIDQYLSMAAGSPVEVVFTPHLVPMDRGILSTCYGRPRSTLRSEDLLHLLRDAYASEPFVRVLERLPATKPVTGTNFCDVTARLVRGLAVVIHAEDNLLKGAAGAAVQNFNLMHGFDETTALDA